MFIFLFHNNFRFIIFLLFIDFENFSLLILLALDLNLTFDPFIGIFGVPLLQIDLLDFTECWSWTLLHLVPFNSFLPAFSDIAIQAFLVDLAVFAIEIE